ncbi:MAG TPA: hypothetical protein DIW46_02065 [Microbacterium sp.]|nr:hypothetical protein [Microbacterium sp.]
MERDAKRRAGTPILGGRATLYLPSEGTKRYQVALKDPVTLKRRVLSANSRESALAKAKEALGDWDEAAEARTTPAPTVAEAFDSWLDRNRDRWSDRTPLAYQTRFNTHLKRFADIPVTAIKASDFANIALDTSREQARRIRTIVKAIFTETERWHGRSPDMYANAIRLPGTKTADAPRTVERSQIPGNTWINGVVDCAWSTFQLHPARSLNGDRIDPETGGHLLWQDEILTDPWTRNRGLCLGMPLDNPAVKRRGMPKHYTRIDARREAETAELASRMRQIGLAHLIGAAAGLRVGEVYALRVWHLFEPWEEKTAQLLDEAVHIVNPHEILEGYTPQGAEQKNGRILPGWTGRIEVCEQVSAATGPLRVSPPKMNRNRTALALPFLFPSWDTSGRTLREIAIAAQKQHDLTFELFNPSNTDTPLWEMTVLDALKLWHVGLTPTSLLIHSRLRELWLQSNKDTATFRNMLLFPTRNPARKRGPGVQWPERWPYPKKIPFGTYQNPRNIAHRYTNHLYDWVSRLTDDNPGHRGWQGNRETGYVHHSLRHWYCSSTLHHRSSSLPTISRAVGHRNPAFTLERYSSALPIDDFGLG